MGFQGRKAVGPPRGGRSTNPRKQQQPTTRQLPPSSASVTQNRVQHVSPSDIQQSILNVFAQAFPIITQSNDVKELMQEVKGHLYNRDFSAAFSKQEYLDVYALRWSAARALAYAEILTHPDRLEWFLPLTGVRASEVKSLRQTRGTAVKQLPSSNVEGERLDPPVSVDSITSSLLQTNLQQISSSESTSTTSTTIQTSKSITRVKVVCIGGGAGAEIVALAATSRYRHSRFGNDQGRSDQTSESSAVTGHLDILAIDIADWSAQIQKISAALTSPLPLSSFTSEKARDANRALLTKNTESQVNVTFKQQDILHISPVVLREALQDATVTTIMFTLNELFCTSLPKTTALLLHLTEIVQVGAHLVVVDSPGSYSEIQLGKPNQTGDSNTKKYPMKWLLDHTLLDVAGKDEEARWIKIESEDSVWFRIDGKLGLRYGVDLENCRYQIHVFRKIK